MGRSARTASGGVLAAAAIAWAMPAGAISPATIDQVVCSADVIVEATVTAVRGTCEQGERSTTCRGEDNALLLGLRIDRVLARRPAAPSGSPSVALVAGGAVTDVYANGIGRSSSSGPEPGTVPFVAATQFSGVAERRWIETAATSADAVRFGQATLIGGAFVVGLSGRGDAETRWFARMWRLDQEPSLLGLLERTKWRGCPTLVDAMR